MSNECVYPACSHRFLDRAYCEDRLRPEESFGCPSAGRFSSDAATRA